MRPRIEKLEDRSLLATWDGGAGTNNWLDADNWNPNVVPNSLDNVVIPDLAGTPTITIGGTANALTITSAERIAITSGTVTIGNAVTDASTFDLGIAISAGTLTGKGSLTTHGSSTWSGSAQLGSSGQALVLNNASDGSWTFSASVVNLQTATFNNSGTFTQTAGQLGINTSTFNNLVGATFNLQDSLANPAFTTPSGSFLNSGSFVDTMAGTHGVSGIFTNNGSMSVASGTFQFPGGNSQAGSFSVAGSSTLEFQSGTSNYNAGVSFSGAGTILFSAGTHVFNTNATINNLVNGATISVSAGQSLTVASSAAFAGGTLNGAGTLVNAGVSTIASTATFAGLFSNTGTITHSAGQLLLNLPGVITNEVGGIFVEQSIVNPAITGAGSFNNLGTINRSSGGTTSFSTNFANAGTVNITSGPLNLTGGTTHAGTFNLSSGTQLIVTNGTSTYATGAAFTGLGIAVFDVGTMNFTGAVTISSPVQFSGGTVTFLENM